VIGGLGCIRELGSIGRDTSKNQDFMGQNGLELTRGALDSNCTRNWA
jgi:hypothetical protein